MLMDALIAELEDEEKIASCNTKTSPKDIGQVTGASVVTETGQANRRIPTPTPSSRTQRLTVISEITASPTIRRLSFDADVTASIISSLDCPHKQNTSDDKPPTPGTSSRPPLANGLLVIQTSESEGPATSDPKHTTQGHDSIASRHSVCIHMSSDAPSSNTCTCDGGDCFASELHIAHE
jgi:hypothetical protein